MNSKVLQMAALTPLVVAPLAIGGVHHETLAVLQLLIAGVGVAILLLRVEPGQSVSGPVLWFAAAVMGLSLLQLIPLPQAVLGVVSPASLDWQSFLAAPPPGVDDPDPDRWFAASLSPADGWVAIGRQASYLLYFLICFTLFARDDRRRPAMVLATVGAVSVALTLLHTLTGAERILWFYELRDADPRPFMGTFVNANFQAAFFGLSGLVALGLSQSRVVSYRHRVALLVAAIGAFVGVYLTLSRSGMTLLPAALVFWLILRRRADQPQEASGVVLPIVATITLAVALYLSAAQMGKELASLAPWHDRYGPTKADTWPQVWELIKTFWTAGIGHGAYPFAFNHFGGEHAARAVFQAPENLVLQALADYGIPGGALVLVLGAAALWAVARRSKVSQSAAGVIAALVFVIGRDLFDFALTAPGIALPVVALLAGLDARSRHSRRRSGSTDRERRRRGRSLGRALGAALVLMTLAGAVASWSTRSDSTYASLSHLRRMAIDAAPTEEFDREFDVQRRRRPVEHTLYWLKAQHLARTGAPKEVARDGIHYINRALFLFPSHAPSHYLAAEYLRMAGYGRQAAIEYKLAAAQALTAAQRDGFLVRRISQRASVDELAATGGADRVIQGRILHLLRKHRDSEAAYKVAVRMGLTEQARDDVDAARLMANTLRWTMRKAALAELVTAMMKHHADSAEAWYWGALIAQEAGDGDAALERIRRSRKLDPHPSFRGAVFQTESTLLRGAKDFDGFAKLLRAAGHHSSLRAKVYRDRGMLNAELGNTGDAISDLRKARSLSPRWAAPRLNLATIFAKAGRWTLASRAYDEILAVHPQHPQALAGREAARKAQGQRTLRRLTGGAEERPAGQSADR